MKHFMTLMALVIAVTAGAQTYYFPHNHDSNQDGFIGVDDLMSLLSEYGQVAGLMEGVEVPEYDFSDFEQTIYDIWSGDIIMDSIYIHWILEGEHTWFPVGSQESETDTIVYEVEAMIDVPDDYATNHTGLGWLELIDNGHVGFWFGHGGSDGGSYYMLLEDNTATNNYLQQIGFLPFRYVTTAEWWHISDGLPDNFWTMDELGWHYTPMVYRQTDIPFTLFECIPYYHYAE